MTTSLSTHRNRKLDEQLSAYMAANHSGVRALLVNTVSEIERLELVIARQYQSLDAIEQAIDDIEFNTLDEILKERVTGAKQNAAARFSNDHQRRRELCARLRRNHSYAALVESRREVGREKAPAYGSPPSTRSISRQASQ